MSVTSTVSEEAFVTSFDIEALKIEDFNLTLTLNEETVGTVQNLDDATACMMLKENTADTSPIMTLLSTGSSGTPRLVIDGTLGTIQILIPEASMALAIVNKYEYDLVVSYPDVDKIIMKGIMRFL